MAGSGGGGMSVQPSLFDMFYEEFLTQFMSSGDLSQSSHHFMKLRTDIERTEFLMRIPFVRDFEIKNKSGIKSVEKAVRYREEGNKLFQMDKCTEAVLFYNKSLSYCPHPSYEEFQKGIELTDQDKLKEVQFLDSVKNKDRGKSKRYSSKYEALSFSYANRSAALRKLNQFDDCLRDIARAAKFGYPKENFFKLWERKGKCYQGLKRYDMSAKCLRQALQSLKDSSLNEGQKAAKTAEIQSLLKELRNTLLNAPMMNFELEEEEEKEAGAVVPNSSKGPTTTAEKTARKVSKNKGKPEGQQQPVTQGQGQVANSGGGKTEDGSRDKKSGSAMSSSSLQTAAAG